MANFRKVNAAVRKVHPDIEVVRGEGYVYFSGEGFDQYDSIMTHPVSTSTEDVIRLALDTLGECPRCDAEALTAHVCPFKADVHDNRDTLCMCCDSCTQDCADDI